MGVFRERRSAISSLGCRLTDSHGIAELAIWGKPRDTLIVGVGRRATSAAGTFKLTVQQAEPPATPDLVRPPSDRWCLSVARCPARRRRRLVGHARGRSAVPDQPPVADAKSVREGVAVSARNGSFDEEYALSLRLRLRRPEELPSVHARPRRRRAYTLHVTASPDVKGPQAYRLLTAPAAKDDFAPGIELQNGADRPRLPLRPWHRRRRPLLVSRSPSASLFRAELLTQPRVLFDVDLIGRHGSAIGTLHSERPGRLPAVPPARRRPVLPRRAGPSNARAADYRAARSRCASSRRHG